MDGQAVAALGAGYIVYMCRICSASLTASLSAAQIVTAVAPRQTLAVLGLYIHPHPLPLHSNLRSTIAQHALCQQSATYGAKMTEK